MTITDLLKSILKGLTEFLNRPVTEISKDYDRWICNVLHTLILLLPTFTDILFKDILTQYKYSHNNS